MRVVLCLLVLVANFGYADTELWISIGSYKDLQSAEELRIQASGQIQESVSVTPADTIKGYFYRVIVGPYLSREGAAKTLQRVQAVGFADAWVFASERFETINRLPDFDELDLDSRVDDELSNFPELPSTREAIPPVEPVTEAPEHYQLHKLHRDV